MKTIFTKLGSSIILITLIFTTLFTGCNSDDEPNNSIVCETFLDCNDGINWNYKDLILFGWQSSMYERRPDHAQQSA